MTNSILLLLAEDEPLVQLSNQDVLQGGGYTVLAASDGTEAMAIIEDRHEELAGLVTDIRLGKGPNGWELAHRARELKPLIAVVYATGDSAGEWAANGVPSSVVLQKPFAGAQLLSAISNLLNEAAAKAPPPDSPVEVNRPS
jgi:CheY-like chemotaxis protein